MHYIPAHVVSWSHERLPFKLRDPGSILSRTSTQGLKITEEKKLFYINISKWLGFASSRIRTLNRRYIGSPINWAIACWEIRSPMSEKLITLNYLHHDIPSETHIYTISFYRTHYVHTYPIISSTPLSGSLFISLFPVPSLPISVKTSTTFKSS